MQQKFLALPWTAKQNELLAFSAPCYYWLSPKAAQQVQFIGKRCVIINYMLLKADIY